MSHDQYVMSKPAATQQDVCFHFIFWNICCITKYDRVRSHTHPVVVGRRRGSPLQPAGQSGSSRLT